MYFVRLLAAETGAAVYELDISKNSGLTNETLPQTVQLLPPNSIVVLKHVDSFVTNRGMTGRVARGLTFSGLLNVLDGALGHSHGLLAVLTTNRYDRLLRDKVDAGAHASLLPFFSAKLHIVSLLFPFPLVCCSFLLACVRCLGACA